MTLREMPTHFGPEDIGLRQPTEAELQVIEKGSASGAQPRTVGFQALHGVAEWGPAHHRDDSTRAEPETPEGLSYSA